MPDRLSNISTKIKGKKRYYKPLKYPIIPLSINDLYVIITAGDRLDILANQFYKDPQLWWIISIANPDILRRDSFNLEPGIEIRIPQNIESILSSFTNLNK